MNRSQFRRSKNSNPVFRKDFQSSLGRKVAVTISFALLTMGLASGPLAAQVDQVRFKIHFPIMPSAATGGEVREIEIVNAESQAAIAVGFLQRTDRPGFGASALLYDPSALINPASTYLGSTPPTGNLWDGYDLLGPPNQWDQNWDDNTIHQTYNELVFHNINAGGLVVGYLYSQNAVPQRIPVYLDLFPSSGTLELKRIPMAAGAAGSSKSMYVNQAGEILVQPLDANDVILQPYIFKPARNGSIEVRTQIPYLSGYIGIYGFNSLGQVMTDDNDVVTRHTLSAGTTQQFPNYILRTIDTGISETFPELLEFPTSTPNGAINELGQFISGFFVRRGPDRGTWATRYGGFPAVKEREWQASTVATLSEPVNSLNDSGDAADSFPPYDFGDAYYYHEGLPGVGDETLILSVKNLILAESDANNVFYDTGSISQDLVSNRNSSGLGWLYGTYSTGVDRRGIAFLEPIIPGQTPGISVSPVMGLVTSESGDSDSFEVVLNAAPTADVTIGITSSITDEGSVDQSSLTFTPGNWNTPKTVIVTGVDDTLDDGNVDYTIVTALATSTDSDYDGLNADDVFVTNLDNEMPPGGPIEYVRVEVPPLPIPDNSNQGAMSQVTGVGDFVPVSLIVSLEITHPRPSDLRAWVTGPDGTQRELINIPGDNDLTSLITDTDGDWLLEVIDTKKKKKGTLNSWKITIDE